MGRITALVLFALSFTIGSSLSQEELAQVDTLLVPEIGPPPTIDGRENDQCWEHARWQSIGHVWIPYGARADTHDYSGKYKIVWSSLTNLLYFLIEIRDGVFVDGFNPGVTADIYNYDITEVFIDEDASGGPHVFDGAGDVGKEWGTNAANAFAYHIYASFPAAGAVTTEHYVGDMGGTDWNRVKTFNYAAHLPDFSLRKNGQTAIWEFSLTVYNDTYTENNKERSRSTLKPGKVMGLSVAYCDNDHPKKEPKVRDFMYGSVAEPSPGNLHWKNADYFGKIRLVGEYEVPRK